MKKLGNLMAAGVLIAVASSGCGGSDEDFCETWESLDALEGSSATEALEGMDQLVDNAPEEVEDDVDVLESGADQFREAMDEAGVDAEEVDEMNPEEQAEILAGIDIDAEEQQEATENIEEWADENCAA